MSLHTNGCLTKDHNCAILGDVVRYYGEVGQSMTAPQELKIGSVLTGFPRSFHPHYLTA
jgi:hypothetical protein